MRKHKHYPIPILSILLAVMILALLMGSAMLLERSTEISNNEIDYVSKTVWHNGVAYYPRQDISTFLILGIDRSGQVVDSGSYNNDGLSDVVMLVVFDKTAETYKVLSFNRDTMVEMPVLGVGGRQVGTDYAQLALSHTYGNGLHTSCENTVDTISGLLNDISINNYLSMNMDVVSILNDAVGGVRVTVKDDFSAVDPTITQGEMVLNGEQAMHYIRLRKGVGDQLNISRMERQESYIDGFLEAFDKTVSTNISKGMKMYDDVRPYAVTNCSDIAMADIFEMLTNYTFEEIITPKGENRNGEKYIEFYLDKDSLDELIIDMFYEEKQIYNSKMSK